MVSSGTGKAAVSTAFDSSEMARHSSNGAARSDSEKTTPATGSQSHQPSEPHCNLPSQERPIKTEVREIRGLLLMKPRDAAANAAVMNRLKAILEDMTLEDLISEGLQKNHVQGLWKIARHNTYEREAAMRRLSGTWSGKSWQSSKGLVDKFVSFSKSDKSHFESVFEVDLPGSPLEGTFKMTIVGPRNDGRYTATLEDNPAANPAFIIHENAQSCHLALKFEDKSHAVKVQETSSSNEQIILYIRVVTAAVLVGQVRKPEKEHKKSSKAEKGHKKSSKAEEELWGQFLLVKDGKSHHYYN